jgi:mannose/fructose-specific phosphotransferase system component IIA
MKILLVSHGDFAAGLCSTLTNFFGASNVYSACVTKENGTADLIAAADKYLDEWGGEQVVICSDIKGGSANQSVFPYIQRDNVFVVSGMNLSLVLQLSMEDEVTSESIKEIMESAKEDMVLINELNIGAMDEDDE